MSTVLDLSDIPVVDNHCHAVEREQQVDLPTWRAFFSESPAPRMRTEVVADTVFYRRLIRRAAAFHGVDATEDAVLAARNALGTDGLVSALFRDARIAGVVIDTGFPAPERAMREADFRAASSSAYVGLLRLEILFQELVAAHASYDDLVEALRDALRDVRAAGHVGFKSIAGYRTGLAITRWSEDDARAAFHQARAEVERTGAVRLGHKPLLDTLLHVAFEAASRQELPVQFHVGYGDPDADLRAAAPLELREVLEDPAYRSMSVVLLHGCWPYFREGGYLASVYDHVHLDVSYAIPFLSMPEMISMTRAVLGVAPTSKLMYSSDGARVPELHWLGAHDGRTAWGVALGELVDTGDLGAAEAHAAGAAILRDNAWVLYGFPGDPA